MHDHESPKVIKQFKDFFVAKIHASEKMHWMTKILKKGSNMG